MDIINMIYQYTHIHMSKNYLFHTGKPKVFSIFIRKFTLKETKDGTTSTPEDQGDLLL